MRNVTRKNADRKMNTTNLLYEKESYIIRGCVYSAYKEFRHFHKESVYHNILLRKLQDGGLKVIKNKKIPIYYRDEKVGTYVPDIVVNDEIILELKSKPFLTKEDRTQFWHYLKMTPCRLGFLINFGNPNGVEIERRVYDKARQIDPSANIPRCIPHHSAILTKGS